MALGRAGANIQLLSNKIYPGHQETAGKDKVLVNCDTFTAL